MKTRYTARAVMLDPEDRVLLFEFQLPDGMFVESPRRFWATPGGAIDHDEDARVAVAREVTEETGLNEFEVGPELWIGEQTLSFSGVPTFCRERFFLIRTAALEIKRDGWTELERQVMRSHRWWSAEELQTTSETIFPPNFGNLIEQFLRDGTTGVRRIAL